MKIEKMNENQIRCTLTKEDLASRQIKISELAYGTEKAKNLFRDMMQQASFEFGFEAEDIPLMIEAIPLNSDCIVLIITKVEDPEELDTRFSRFAPSVLDETDAEDDYDSDSSEEMSDLFQRIQNSRKNEPPQSIPRTLNMSDDEVAKPSSESKAKSRIFILDSLGRTMDAAKIIKDYYVGSSVLYKDNQKGNYILYLSHENNGGEFDRVCNTLSEYGTIQPVSEKNLSFLDEHCEKLIADNAISRLG